MDFDSLGDLIAHHPMPQKELAGKLGVEEQTVSGWKSRGVPPEWWDRVKEHLELSEEELIRALSLREILTGIDRGMRFRQLRPGLRLVLRETLVALLEGDERTATSLGEMLRAAPARPAKHGDRP